MSIAHELITRGHNTNGLYEGDDGSVCLERAAQYAYGSLSGSPNHVYEAMVNAIRRVDPESKYSFITHWSDTHTFDEVLRVAKEADEILGAL